MDKIILYHGFNEVRKMYCFCPHIIYNKIADGDIESRKELLIWQNQQIYMHELNLM